MIVFDRMPLGPLDSIEANSLMAGDRNLLLPLIRLQGVTKVYHSAAGDLTALDDVNADFRRGELVVIVGKSGAGKSTLVNMITGVDHLTRGEIWVDGTAVHTLNERQMALWRGRNVGIVYQSFQLLPTVSLLDNVLLPMDFCGLYRPGHSEARARQLLAQVGLDEHIRKRPTQISGGQQQRVAIARALANDPPIVVADEPTGNLDSSTAEAIFGLFESLVAQGKAIIMVTHDLSLARRASRSLNLVDGRLVGDEAN